MSKEISRLWAMCWSFLRPWYVLILFATFFSTIPLHAETVTWISDTSGDWNTVANWSPNKVPTAADDVVIDRPTAAITVTISSGDQAAKSVSCNESLRITAGSLTLTQQASQVSGSFTISGGARLIVSGATAKFTATGAASINNGRFFVRNGAVVSLPGATSYDTRGLGPT
ncbi:hypothetical protein OAO01_04855, partial [Oligoflexia bacterium]|nr:hypothetical protein [Oligoflexia bacterium]